MKDPALSAAYRERYPTCHMKYSLGVPFTERFFSLAQRGEHRSPPGYVGMITANSFMKRQFGKKLIEAFFVHDVELTHIIDTSGAYIPGHGTPTVILFGRDQKPTSPTIRAVLGIRGEPGAPDDPACGLVWSAITEQVDRPGSETEFISVEDASRDRYATHPWSLQGGAAPLAFSGVEDATSRRLSMAAESIGFAAITGEDGLFTEWDTATPRRLGLSARHVRGFVPGDVVRDWRVGDDTLALFPYDESLTTAISDPMRRLAWAFRSMLRSGLMFGKTREERGLDWAEYTHASSDRLLAPLSIVFAEVATHNHFVLDRGGKVFKQTAPVIKLPEGASEGEHLELLGLLNSSTACFWMKQVFHNKGNATASSGMPDQPWSWNLQFDGTKLKQFPLPSGRPLVRAQELDRLASELSQALPSAVAARAAPTREALKESRRQVASLRARMVAVQEELDWECYRLYGLVDEDLTLPADQLPELSRGERAFEIVLARRMVAGVASTRWFERHGSTPITELPAHWPEAYRRLVEQRIELIEGDRTLGLLERPEYKRRWNWDSFDDLAQRALRGWLLDRLEAAELWADTRVMSAASLADRLRGDAAFGEVARLYAGSADADLADVVEKLVLEEAVPYLAALRLKPAGLRKRNVWERVWELQRLEDAIDARCALPAEHPDHLDAEAAAVAKKEQVGTIPVPPRYASADFTKPVYWRLRGKLDVPKERFVLLPGTQVGSAGSAVIGWAGWDHLQQAQALSGQYVARKDEGAEPEELTPLLAGLDELVPWLTQWHNDIDPVYGERMGEFFDAFVDTEARTLGLTRDDLTGWTPPATTRRRTKART